MKSLLRILLGLFILTAIFLAAQWLVAFLDVPFPGSLAGLLLCTALLKLRLIRVEWVEGAADLLLSHLSLFYLPFLAALGQFGPLFRASGLTLVGIVIASTEMVLLTTGLVAERLSDSHKERKHVALSR